MEIKKETLLNIMYSMRLQIEGLISLLEEDQEEEECKHPPQFRRNYTTMGGPEHWVCELCGYEYKEEKKDGES